MERQLYRRMGLSAILSLFATMRANNEKPDMSLFNGGYSNASHGWSGKRRKFKATGNTGRRSKAQRRARRINRHAMAK